MNITQLEKNRSKLKKTKKKPLFTIRRNEDCYVLELSVGF